MRNLISILAILTTHSALAEVKVSYNDEITPKSLTKLEDNIRKTALKIKASEERKVVITLGSGGGNLYAALSFVGRINEISAKNNVVIDTRVTSSCESACTVLFTAGNQRRAGRWAQFGFHSPAIASKVPKGMDRKVILEEARRVWIDAISAVDPTLAGVLIKRKLLHDDDMTYLSRTELGTGYVTDRE